jgi:hypothetical protein
MPVVAETEFSRQLVQDRKLIRRKALHDLFNVIAIDHAYPWLEVVGIIAGKTIILDADRV